MYRNNRVVVEAPAKINLYLDITGRAPNGYHLLESVMQAVDLCDTVVVGRSAAPGIRVTCSHPGVPEDETNLAHRAAQLFLQALPTGIRTGLHIHIDKCIPPLAGLGGGSADAAGVLVGLNQLLNTGLSPEALCELALALGADVPFAVRGGCAFAQGVGEQLSPFFPGLRPCWLAIAKPQTGVSTREAYARYDALPAPAHADAQAIQIAIATGSLADTARQLFNVFEQVAPRQETARLKTAMRAHGARGAVLSGSGSAVVGLFDTREAAEGCAAALASPACETFLAAPAPHGAQVVHKS